MAIRVTCPGCHTRFNVADKYAGQQGPCPKCKTVITIPKPEDEVVVHEAEHEAGAVGVSGRHALKTYRRRDTKFQPVLFAAVIGSVLVLLLVALVFRGLEKQQWLLAAAAVLLGPPAAWAGYTFLRDDELEGYNGKGLAIRATACGLVYALLWGIYMFVGGQIWGWDAMAGKASGLEVWQMVVLGVLTLGIGTGAAYVSFDLEPGSGFFHCAMYFGVTVLLRAIAGLPALPGL
jgi:hypothetical protein